ncbi:MAG: hypothetical protein KJO18_03315, partial [Acidimicrobiia bacterium]|nr:hypothetical protein [Acidimicrobiia bacterium]
PREVDFRAGGIEMKLPLRIGDLRLPTRLDVRFEPAVERVEGAVQLLPVRLELVGIPSLSIDLESWIEPVSLPRRVQWSLPLDGGDSMQVEGFVQGLRVLENRLELALTLTATQSPTPGSSR